jgi:predicted adenine nucleotide alpha hydrolase (AANH) superfamily ATPase
VPKPKILVHVCCAPDGAYVIGLLRPEYDITGFFYNPNIHPAGEYDRRVEDMRRVAVNLAFPLIEGEYDDTRWLSLTRKFKDEPEKGRRCDICYALRLERTAQVASEREFDFFTTVMTLSPWKKAPVLNRVGRMLGRRHHIAFLEADFKKKDGFRKSVALSRELKLYRQDYCGCIYSLKDSRGHPSAPEEA